MTNLLNRTARISLLCLTLTLSALAHAAFPDRTIRIVAPAPPGGGIDILSRTLAERLSAELGVTVIVENKAGAGGTIGAEYVARQPADGYTILMGGGFIVVNPHLNPKIGYNAKEDFAPLSLMGRVPMILVANPSFPPSTVTELIAYAKSQPGGLKYAHGGVGASSHLAGELFRISTQAEVIPVAYKGNAPALADVLAGHVPVIWDTINTASPMVRAGKLKVMGITSAQRAPSMPQVPTMMESGLPNFEISAWYMLMAPKKTPVDVQQKLSAAIAKSINSPSVLKILGEQGVQIASGTREQAEAFFNQQSDYWGDVIRKAGIKAE
ncbi:MAG: tripartite tricarboxylate transporter substrate binding protein [Pseudomonadota bacterium]